MPTESNLQVPSTSSVTLETTITPGSMDQCLPSKIPPTPIAPIEHEIVIISSDESDTDVGKDGPSEKRVKIGESRKLAVPVRSARVSNKSQTHSTPNKISLQVRNDN